MFLLSTIHRAHQKGAELLADLLPKDSTLTPRQIDVLGAIEREPGASQTRLVEMTDIDRSTLADIVKRLKRHGLVSRHRTKEDARAYAVKLTDDGEKALKEGRKAMAKAEQQLIEAMPKVKHLANGK